MLLCVLKGTQPVCNREVFLAIVWFVEKQHVTSVNVSTETSVLYFVQVALECILRRKHKGPFDVQSYVMSIKVLIELLQFDQVWTWNMVRKEDHGWGSTSEASWLESPTTWRAVPTLMHKEEVSWPLKIQDKHCKHFSGCSNLSDSFPLTRAVAFISPIYLTFINH